MVANTIAVLTALTLVILVGMGVAMVLSVIFSPDDYDDIRDTD
jgi:hypothetical protein